MIRLRKRFRCIAPDLLGFGLSEHPHDFGYTPKEHADVVLQLLRYLDLRDVTVMGHDWGGPIGMRVALDESARMRALVMGNTWYWPTDAWQLKAFSYVMSSAPMQKLILERNFLVERLLPVGVKHSMPTPVHEHYAGVLPDVDSRYGVAELPRQILSSSFWLGEIAHAVPRILMNVPLLLTWGMHDIAYTPRFMDRFREDFRSVSLRRLDARHYIQEDCPAEISEAIEGFLRPQG